MTKNKILKQNDPLNSKEGQRYFILPKEMQQVVQKRCGLDLDRAYVLSKSVTPKNFPQGEGKETFVLEYGCMCVDLGANKGYVWVSSKMVCQFICPNCNETVSFDSSSVKSDDKKKLFCSESCKKGCGVAHIYVNENSLN